MTNSKPIFETDLHIENISLFKKGKVRDVYDLGDKLLIVSTDRLSAFDVIMKEPIPDKGKILTSLSSFWFKELENIVPSHFITSDVFSYMPSLKQEMEQLKGRSMIVKKANLIPFECIVRGYLMGSAYREYMKSGTICGQITEPGLKKGSRFSTPLFTPSTKAEEGHDENISFDQMKKQIGSLADTLKEYSLKLFNAASEYALSKGIIIADTKVEFGMIDGEVILIDEVFTPDSSRFILKKDYDNGLVDQSMDKEFIRAYLASLDWDKQPPPPSIPDDVIEKTQHRYQDIKDLLTQL